MEDLEITFPEDTYEVIHNPIDTNLFNFDEKDIQQRFKILSIRPYASRKYANDLSVNAVLALSKKDFFKDDLDERMSEFKESFTLALDSHDDQIAQKILCIGDCGMAFRAGIAHELVG